MASELIFGGEQTPRAGSQSEDLGTNPFRLIFFDPSRLFHAISVFLHPVSVMRHLILPSAILAGVAAAENWNELSDHLTRMGASIAFWQHLLLSLFTVNLLKNVMMGVTLSHFGAAPHAFGVQLFLGVLPRFFVSIRSAKQLNFKAQRVCYSAPLLTQLALASTGVLAWALLRHSNTGAADLFLVLGISAFIAFLFTANPLWTAASGCRWLSAFLKRPKLSEHSLRLLFLVMSREPLPSSLGLLEAAGLLLFAFLTITYTAVLLFVVGGTAAIILEAEFRGAGAIIFCVLLSSAIVFLSTRSPNLKNPNLRNRSEARRKALSRAMQNERSNKPGPGDRGNRYDITANDLAGVFRRLFATPGKTETKMSVPSGRDDASTDAAIQDRQQGSPMTHSDHNEVIPNHAHKTKSLGEQPPGETPDPSDDNREPPRRPAKQARSPALADTRKSKAPTAQDPIDELNRVLTFRSKVKPPKKPLRTRLIWLGIIVALLVVCFLPYPFDVGGEFIVQPADRAQVRARTDGEIMSLHVKEGDWVEEGALMATLSNWDKKRDVAVREAELKGLRAELETLKYGARTEEVSLARQKVASADLQVNISRVELERQRLLYESKTISQKALTLADSNYQAALAARSEARAQLALVQSSAQENEILAAEATIARNEEDLAYSKLLLEYTNIRATAHGQIVSSLKETPVGAYLPEGALFAELEDSRTIIAEVEVPETEISEVKIGAEVKLKSWSGGGQSVAGVVSRIAPKAEERPYGRVIRVIVELPGPGPSAVLAVNMTGEGKIAVGNRPVWEVFTRTLTRFFTIELWSWVP